MRFPSLTRPLAASMGVCLLVSAAVVSTAGRAGKDSPAPAVEMDLLGAVHDVGELRMTVSNWGMFGSMPGSGFLFSSKPSAEWPTGSGVEYLFSGGIWISSSTWSPRVSTALPVWEFRPPPDPIDVIYRTAEEAPGGNRAAHPHADDDGDGRVNEEWPDGHDNDGDGEIDEDYAAISDQMFARWYTDDQTAPIGDHQPLHITVREQSFQWAHDDYDDFVGFQYEIRNTGTDIHDDVYIGIMLDVDAGARDVTNYWRDDLVAIDTVSVDHGAHGMRDYDFVYGYDADGDGGTTTAHFGIVVLGITSTTEGAQPAARVVTYAHFSGSTSYQNGGDPSNDFQRLELMRSHTVERPPVVPGDYRSLLVVGPIQGFRPDDTITFAMAAVATPNDGTFANVKNAAELYEGEWFDRDGNPATGIDGKEFQEHWFIPGNLPVRIPRVTAAVVRGGVRLEWTVESDVALDGFQVVRRDPGAEARELVGGLLVPSTRSFVDTTAKPGQDHEYAVWGYGVTGMPGRSDFVAVSVPAGDTALEQNHPNPFNPTTTIPFNLDAHQKVELTVFDAGGRRVATLVNVELDAGPHAVEWDGTDDLGRAVVSGVYFYRLTAGGVEQTKKMMLLK